MDQADNTSSSLADPCAIDYSALNIFLMVLYSLLFLVAVGGNLLVCCVVLGQERMRTVTNFFLLNLAIGDMMKGLFCIPATYVINILVPYWPFPGFMCPLLLYTQAVVVFLSAFTLVAMSIDRYVAILHPLRPKLTSKKAFITIFIVWTVALLVPLPTLINSKIWNPYVNKTDKCQKGLCSEDFEDESFAYMYSTAIMCIQYFVPLAVLMFTYSRIGYIIWIKRTPGEAERRRDERIASSKRKMVKMMIVMVIAYAACWLPLHTIQLIQEAHESVYDFEPYQYIWTTAHWIAMSYACCNPIVYFWMNKRFRAGFKNIFFFCRRCKKRFIKSVSSGMRIKIPQRNNSGSSSRFSPRESIDETRIVKMSSLHKDGVSFNDL